MEQIGDILRHNILTLVISNLNCLVATRINQSETTLIIFVVIVCLAPTQYDILGDVMRLPERRREGPGCGIIVWRV